MKRPRDIDAHQSPSGVPFEFDRRTALKLLSSGLALSLAACGRPYEQIVPYVDMPEGLTPGEPMKFATTLALNGYGRGMLATSVDGRPIKIEGNPRHPASLGATDAFAEAAIMSLYDPNRAKAPRHDDNLATWDAFMGALQQQIETEQKRGGAGLRIVSGRITSPTLVRQMNGVLKQFPRARWYSYEPISEDNLFAGSDMAYGRRLLPLPRLEDAAVVLALNADPLGPGPRQMANARAYSARRRRDAEPFMRLYAIEPALTLTGAAADHRHPLRPDLIRNFALAVAAALQGQTSTAELPKSAASLAKVCAADLLANKGKALVTVGHRQPAEVHALCHWINAQLDAPVDLIAPLDGDPLGDAQGLQALTQDLDEGSVKTLIVLDANPAYDTPGSLGLADKIGKVEFSAALGLHDDETGHRCRWQLPLSHPLESWSDLRAIDGTASIVQPLIRPLYDSRTAHELIAFFTGNVAPSSYRLVRETWRKQATAPDFEKWWRQALHDGVIAGTAAKIVEAGAPKNPDLAPVKAAQGLTLALTADPSVWDGRFGNNPWLQETPHPFSKEVWGNSVEMPPDVAAQFKLDRRRRGRDRQGRPHGARSRAHQRSPRGRLDHGSVGLRPPARRRHRRRHRLRRLSAAAGRRLLAGRQRHAQPAPASATASRACSSSSASRAKRMISIRR